MVHSNEQVVFGVQWGMANIYFTKQGVHYTFLKTWKKEKDLDEIKREMRKQFSSHEEYMEHEKEERAWKHSTDVVNFSWQGANPNVEIEGISQTKDYHSYCINDGSGKVKNINYIPAFEKIIYRNLYPGIDVVYEFHLVEGLKYSLIIHPHADPSQVKLLYNKIPNLQPNGDIVFKTKFGPLTDHAPKSFLNENQSQIISSSFSVNGKMVGFNIGNYNHNETLVIDPWVQSPTFGTTSWHVVWECERDGAGNAYIIGGGASQSAGSQMQVKKYNASGVLQWTYNTPYDTSNCWLGTIATDNAGNSYVTAGSVAQIQKISTAGGLIWNNASPGGLFSTAEFWDITFNCDQTRLVVGGTGGGMMSLEAYIYQIDVNSGNVLSQVSIAKGSMMGFPPSVQEVRAITPCPNGKYYFLTHDTIGYVNQNFTLCPSTTTSLLKINSGLGLGYKCENYRFDNSGICAIKADANFVYVHRGNQIQKRSLATLAVVATAAIPGGAFTNVAMSGNTVENSGIDIDNCGNIYVGSKNQVVKFSSNLVQLATYATTFNVYDVAVSSTGEVFACGSTGTSSTTNRTGSVQSIGASACSIIPITCCDATICKPAAVCSTAPPFNLTAATPGGTWSGPGITNASVGTFNPSVAGPGNHWIKYTLACGKDSVQIKVNNCTPISVCINANGSLTASGTGPFTWYKQTTVQNCSACLVGCNFPPGCAVNVTTWTSFGTGATVTPTGYPVYVVTPTGDSAYIANAASVPGCSSCAITPSLTSFSNVTCFGANNGSATVGATGGTGTFSYSWAPSGGSAATATNLAPGTYTATITSGTCTATQTVSITQPTAINATLTPVPTTCGQNNGSISASASGGTGTLTYSWTPGGATGSSVNNLAPGTYTVQVKDANNCTYTTTAVVATSAAPTATITYSGPFCSSVSTAQSVTQTGSTGGTYSAVPVGLNINAATGSIVPSLSTPGTYTVTYTIPAGGGCSTYTTSATVVINSAPVISPIASPTITCTLPTASLNAVSAGNTLVWNGGSLSNSPNPASVNAAGIYTVTATSPAGCSATQAVSVVTNTVSPGANAVSGGILTCSTNTVTLSGSSPTSGVSYQWSGGPGTPNYSVGSPGTYTLTVTDPVNGCVSTATVSVSQSGSFPNISITPPGTITCSQASVTLIGGSTTPGVSFQWAGGPAGTTYTVNAPGTYTFTVTDPSNNCVSTQTVSVSSNTVTPIISSASGGIITCTNTSVNLSATSAGSTLVWNGGSLTNQPNPAITSSPGTYTVTATDPGNGCISTATVSVSSNTVTPVVTIGNPGVLTCTTLNTTLTANSATTGLNYQWAGGPATNTFVVNNAGSYTVSATDPSNGCVGSASVTVTSNTIAPVVNPSNNGPLSCSQQNVSLSSNTMGYISVWNGSGLNNAPDPANTTVAGTYTVTVTDPVNGCISNSTTVVSSNVVLPNVSIAPAGQLTCTSSQVNLQGSSTTPGVTYQWSGGPSTSVYSVGLPGTYTLTVTDPANNCTNSATVTVTQAPQFTLSINATNVSCNGGSNGTATAIPQGNGPFTYSWTGSGSQTLATATNLPAGSYTVTVTETSSGCVQNVSITITEPLPMSITANASATQVCQGTSVNLNGLAQNGTGPYNYLWSTGQSGQNISSVVAANTTYTLTVTDANNCSANTTVTVNVVPAPSVNFSGTNLFGCSPVCAVLTTTVVAQSYSWNFGDGSSSSQQNATHCYSNPGNYNITLSITDNTGCTGTQTVNNFVSVYPNAQAGFIATPNPVSVLDPRVEFSNTSTNATSYLWYFGNDDMSSVANPVYVYPDAGTYTVTLIANNSYGCPDTVRSVIRVEEDFAVYIPNAFSPDGDGLNEVFMPKGVGISKDDYTLLIFDRWGQEIFKTHDLLTGWDGTFKGEEVQIDVYIYKILLREEVKHLKHEYTGTISVIK